MKLRKVPLLILLALVACTLGVIPGCWSNRSTPVLQPAQEVATADVPKAPPGASSNRSASKGMNSDSGGNGKAEMLSAKKNEAFRVSSDVPAARGSKPSDKKVASYSKPMVGQSQNSSQQEQALQNSLDRLATGAFFHNVPHTMRSNRSEIIEAGITKNFTKQLRQELQGEGEVVVKQNVRYDPTGVTIQLKASPEEFYINQISGGKQVPIVDGKSEIWRWKVTPLRRGTHYLNLTSTVDIYIPQQERKYSKEVVIYKEPISVQVNVGYSIQQFILNHGLQVVISAIAILFGLFAWWKGVSPRRRVQGLQHLQ